MAVSNNDYGEYVTFCGKTRLLPVDLIDSKKAFVGKIWIRIYPGSKNSIKSEFSSEFEDITSYFLRAKNLLALRGRRPGTEMVGPTNYFCNLEESHKYLYTIDIIEGFPLIKRYSKQHKIIDLKPIRPQPPEIAISATWIKGNSDTCNIMGESIFSNPPGILLIDTHNDSDLVFPSFPAQNFDLSRFNARLVKNSEPFRINDTQLDHKESFSVISYYFGPFHAQHQVDTGRGISLETHSFAQTITPLDETCGGFVSLARKLNKHSDTDMSIIAVQVPYGHTLIIDPYCIHGDATLQGSYMMVMTADHASMDSADTAFLQNVDGAKIGMCIDNIAKSDIVSVSNTSKIGPLFVFDGPDYESAVK